MIFFISPDFGSILMHVGSVFSSTWYLRVLYPSVAEEEHYLRNCFRLKKVKEATSLKSNIDMGVKTCIVVK